MKSFFQSVSNGISNATQTFANGISNILEILTSIFFEEVDYNEYETNLKDRRNRLAENIKRRKSNDRRLITVGIIFAVLALLLSFFVKDNDKDLQQVLIVSGVLYGLICALAPLARNTNVLEKELQNIENELELETLDTESGPKRAEKLFKNHHLELKRYYDENLNQSRVLFRVGIVCIIVGFLVVAATVWLVWENLDNELANKLIIASLGAIGAILSNFIGVMYLKMHAETTKSLTQFHNRFVNTHHFHFGNFLISKIEDQARREKALANLALSINQQANLEQLMNQQNQMNSQNQPNQGTQ